MGKFYPKTPNKPVLGFPTEAVSITQYFSKNHQAIDIANGYGSIDNEFVRAPWSGKVTASGYGSAAGYYIDLQLDNGYSCRHCHLEKKSWLDVGTKVKFWEAVGYLGNTGESTGAHDHFVLWKTGSSARLDPCKYLVRFEGQPVHPDDVNIIKLYTEIEITKVMDEPTINALKKFLNSKGANLALNGELDKDTVRVLQNYLNTVVYDVGRPGSGTIGFLVTEEMDTNTVNALQILLNNNGSKIVVSGELTPYTIGELQEFLNKQI